MASCLFFFLFSYFSLFSFKFHVLIISSHWNSFFRKKKNHRLDYLDVFYLQIMTNSKFVRAYLVVRNYTYKKHLENGIDIAISGTILGAPGLYIGLFENAIYNFFLNKQFLVVFTNLKKL